MKTWNVLPFPQQAAFSAPKPAPAPLPAWPVAPATGTPDFPKSWPSPLATLPFPTSKSPSENPTAELPTFPSGPVAPIQPAVAAPVDEAAIPEPPDFTDDDLREAFGPIVEQAVRKAVYAQENGIDTYLEPMLRSTIRRALAEYAPAARPFQPPGTWDRLVWHVQALFTSRTYEDIFFEKTRRFQVEEVFLLDSASLALVSYASCDPARHASVRRVTATVHRLALQLRDEAGKIRQSFEVSDHRNVISRQGRHVVLTALVRGNPGELAFADLEFALRRIEDHFRDQFQQEGSALLFTLQPFLEDCLLIQAPASAA
jgi:hypothetical protein